MTGGARIGGAGSCGLERRLVALSACGMERGGALGAFRMEGGGRGGSALVEFTDIVTGTDAGRVLVELGGTTAGPLVDLTGTTPGTPVDMTGLKVFSIKAAMQGSSKEVARDTLSVVRYRIYLCLAPRLLFGP